MKKRTEWALILGPSVVPGVLVLAITTCGSGLTPAAAKALNTARTSTGMAYQHVGADTASGAEMRLARCAVEKVMRDYSVPVVNDDAGITCKAGQ